MNDACATLSIDRETDKDGDGRQVVGNEIRSAIEWIYPNNSLIAIERIKSMLCVLDFILSVIWSQECVDKILSSHVLKI